MAVAMVEGPDAALDLLATLDDDARMARHYRPAAVRAKLTEMAGDRGYQETARRTTSIPERRYLESRADRLRDAR